MLVVRLREDRQDDAYLAAREGLAIVGKLRQTSLSTLTGIVGITEVLLRLWSASRAPGSLINQAEVSHFARLAVKRLTAFAKVFPMGMPASLLMAGIESRLLGKANHACSQYANAMQSSKGLGMPRELAQAQAALAGNEFYHDVK